MMGLLAKLPRWWRTRRSERNAAALAALTARYQTFRTLLDSNSQAVELVTDLGVRLESGEIDGAFREKAAALSRAVSAMADKFTALDGMRQERVAAMRERLAGALAEELARIPEAGAAPLALPLAEEPARNIRLAGGKAAELARLGRDGRFRVPAGFVITAPACRLFYDHNDLALHAARLLAAHAEGDDQAPLAAAAGDFQALIRQASLPPRLREALDAAAAPFFREGRGLAVRSSAIAEDAVRHSFAGQYASVLHVTDAAQLADAFRTVLASAFSPRAIVYRRHAGLPPLAFDMAVLCLEMVPARAAGIAITREPGGGSTLVVSAVPGLGEAAVGGSAAADIYHVSRAGIIDQARTVIARKDQRLTLRVGGGVGTEPVPAAEQNTPAVDAETVVRIARWALAIEALHGGLPQDIEWAVDQAGTLFLLQARPLPGGETLPAAGHVPAATTVLVSGGQVASRGRGAGRVRMVRRREDLDVPAGNDPLVLVLPQSLPDAARLVDQTAAIVVELGNPADHLANVARENGIPMLCGVEGARTKLAEGTWVEVDTAGPCVRKADAERALLLSRPPRREKVLADDPRVERLRALLTRLNLTDAYGPSFNLLECRSFHDLIRFIHEKAVLALFEGSDALLEETGSALHLLAVDGIPFPLSVIDLGGALLPDRPRRITPEDIAAAPFKALWAGIASPGLRWGPPAEGGGMGAVFSQALTDHQSDRPLGMPNYLVAGRDYLNLNARMDFHFIMVDAVASLDPLANHIRFRFKGGGTTPERRARRARCIAAILEASGFFANVRDDLVGAELQGAPHAAVEERLTTIGRLLGFTRLLDAGMNDDLAAQRAASAFLEGDYGGP